jgi:transcriptional regulator with XRE-family HTH domain
MFSVELYGRVRHACQIEGLSQREAARRFGLHRNTVRKMLAFSVPPGYRRTKPAARPKLDPFTPIIDGILEADGSAPPKQRHTSLLHGSGGWHLGMAGVGGRPLR